MFVKITFDQELYYLEKALEANEIKLLREEIENVGEKTEERNGEEEWRGDETRSEDVGVADT